MRFSRITSVVFQTLAASGQILNALGPIIPEAHKLTVASILGALQIVGGILASNSNPDGTPSRVPYVPEKEK